MPTTLPDQLAVHSHKGVWEFVRQLPEKLRDQLASQLSPPWVTQSKATDEDGNIAVDRSGLGLAVPRPPYQYGTRL